MKRRIVHTIICAGFLAALAVGSITGNVPGENTLMVEEPQQYAEVAVVDPEEDLVDNFEESVEIEGDWIPEEEVPLAPNASSGTKVTTKKSTKTKKSTGTLKEAAKKTKTVTKKTTKVKKNSSKEKKATIVKETKTVTTKKTHYTKGSTTTQITTKINTEIKTTTIPKGSSSSAIASAAKKADPKLLQRFSDEGYKYVVDSDLEYIGLFSSRNKQITMRYQSNIVYHELGHYLAYTTGKTDLTDEFINIYEKEYKKFDGDNKAYVTSTCREYFAESYRDYVTRKSHLKKTRPKTYRYIEEVLDML